MAASVYDVLTCKSFIFNVAQTIKYANINALKHLWKYDSSEKHTLVKYLDAACGKMNSWYTYCIKS